MKRLFAFLLLVIGVHEFGYGAVSHSQDSVGVTEKGGSKYIIHQVDAGETLYALSRKYQVSVQELKDANSTSISSLNIGQKVYIPIIKKGVDKNATSHIVKSSETLFSISRSYNVTVDELKEWNNLSGNSISAGQELTIKNGKTTESAEEIAPSVEIGNRKTHTVEEAQTLYSISRMHGVSTDKIKQWNQLSSNNLSIGQLLVVSSGDLPVKESKSSSSMLPPSENQAENAKEIQEETVEPVTEETPVTHAVEPEVATEVVAEAEKVAPPAEKVVQRGMAEVIEDSQNTKKYLALHRDAPVGTIMQVKNEMNSQTVFVRVVGSIPPTGDNGKLLMKISKKAYDRLGAVDNRFPVEVSYIP